MISEIMLQVPVKEKGEGSITGTEEAFEPSVQRVAVPVRGVLER